MSFFFFLCLAGMVSGALDTAYGIPESVTFIAMLALTVGFALMNPSTPNSNIVRADVQVEMWVNYIIKRLWKDNKFLTNAYNDDEYVVGGKIVHIPQPGAKPSVVKNRSSFPAAAVRRTDSDIFYPLDEYSSDPTHIQDAETKELSYSKQDSVMGDHAGALNQAIADDLIQKWSNGLIAANILATTGASAAAKVSGQTGNRLTAVHGDLKRARLQMNLQDIPSDDRFALIEENMMDEIADSLTATQYKDFSQHYDAKTGVIGKLYNFNIMTRSTVAMSAANLASGKLVVNPLGTATSATDQVSSICWQKDSVARALGNVEFFENIKDATYYGDVYSALIRMGGRRRRADDAGVIVLRQANGS